MTLTPGTRIGPYEILSALGAGDMGEVYKARDHLSQYECQKCVMRTIARMRGLLAMSSAGQQSAARF